MSLEAGLFQLLSSNVTLQGLSGGDAAGFVFPILLKEGVALPALTYQTVGGSQVSTMNSAGMIKRRLQLDFFADLETGTATQAFAMRDAAVLLLDGFRGALPNGLLVNFHCLQLIDHFENDARQYRCTAEFYAYYSRPAS